MRSLCLTAAALSIMILAAGCGDHSVVTAKNEKTEITLSWWGNDGRNEYTLAAVEEFEKLHPDIKVTCSYSEWSGFEARTRIRMISDTESDVMQINFGWLDEYSPDGTGYYDINKLSEYIDLSAFDENMLEYGMVSGSLNAIPIAMNTQTVYINKTVYNKYGLDIPQTWEDIFAAAKVMSPDGVFPMSGTEKSIWIYSIAYAEQQLGKPFLKEDSSLNFTTEDIAVMIDFYCRLVNEKVLPQAEFYERLNINDGTYAGVVAWISDAESYCGTAIENGFEYVVADYTAFSPAESGSGWYAKPATMYAVSKNTQHPKESAMLLDFLLNSKEMAVLQGTEKGIPLSSSAKKHLEEEGMLSGMQYEASLVMEGNDLIGQLDPYIETTSVIDKFIETSNLVLYDKATLDDAAARLREYIISE